MASRQNSSLTAKEKSSHSKPETKLKHGKVIHKFTSESYMRLTCDSASSNAHDTKFIDKSSSNSSTSTPTSVASSNSGCGGGSSGGGGVAAVAAINNVANKRKGASFQITSVSVSSTQHPHHIQHIHRNSTDNNGDDSADDLDDSHTDDNISRITDYETPSISETFSGEDVFFAQQNAAFGTAPVIPTSSQYGLAIVGPDLGGNGANLSDVHVSVTDAGINIMGPISSKQDPDHKNERFKVVKIESTEPFKRGRWMCMDYLDHTTLQAQDDGIDGASSNDDQMTKDEATDETTKLLKTMNNGEIEHVISDNEDLDHEVNKINSHHRPNEASHQHPATMTSIQISNDYSNVNMQQQHHHVVAQSMPQAQIETMFTQEKLHLQHPENQTISEQQQHINPPTSQQQNAHLQQQHAQTMTPEMIHASFMHQEQVTSHHQGVTLPTNLILQNIEQSQQLNSPNNSSNVTLPPPPQQQQQQTTTITLNEHLVDHDGTATTNSTVTNQFQNSQVGDSNRNESEIHSQQQQQILVANVVNSESVSSPSSSAGPGTVAEGVIVNSNNTIVSEINESAGVNAAAATVGAENDGQTLNEDNER